MILDNVSESICPEFKLNSKGTVRQFFPEMMGDYFLQSVRNSGRNVYRTKNVVSINYQQYPTVPRFIHLYSLDAEQYADDENYEELKDYAGTWVVSFIKY